MQFHKLNQGITVLVLFALVLGCTGKKAGTDRDRYFNEDWKFIRDSLPGNNPQNPAFDDSQWMLVDLPHDWSITSLPGQESDDQTGPFSKKSPGATSTGYVLGGTAWYRKNFSLDKKDSGKRVIVKFDGVYMETDVWVNGKPAGNHVYGYTPFNFDITELLNDPGENNIIAVKVSNTGRNSRWYSGSGIYRNVFLTVTDPVHVDIWGVQVITSDEESETAGADIRVSIKNDTELEKDVKVNITITSPEQGTEVASANGEIKVSAGSTKIFDGSLKINNPVLWSLSSPALYQVKVTLELGGRITDQYVQPFGFRTVQITAENGLLLNGEPVELKGGCMHHDNGLLGSAAFERAEERRVQIMKDNGFNAIRTSHNPPSEAFLNACDRLGMLVIDETFDIWERAKNPKDYHRFYREWWKKDVESMILRDRNHPSIIMWSIGNEIPERADTSGVRIGKAMIDFIKTLDDTRPFTNAVCEFWDNPGWQWERTAAAFEILDVGGYNYQYLRYEGDHEKYPQRIMMGTESVPKDAYGNWEMVEKHPYVIGDFVWTGMDYLGETGIGHTQYLTKDQKDQFAMTWPWFNAWCGDIDIIGHKKPQMVYRDVLWRNSELEMNVHPPVPEGKTEVVSYWGWPDEYPHWNWKGQEDKIMQVSVYTRSDSVSLSLNGREIGRKAVSPATKLTAVFDVPYEPGELNAIAYRGGKEIARKIFKTTGEPAAIQLKADRDTIAADRNDLSFVTIEVIDEFGQVVTDSENQVTIEITGNGELAGSGNACPYDMESVGRTTIKAFHGKAMAILRPYTEKGSITISVTGEGLAEASAKILVQ